MSNKEIDKTIKRQLQIDGVLSKEQMKTITDVNINMHKIDKREFLQLTNKQIGSYKYIVNNNIIYNNLMDLNMNLFEWENIPDGIPVDYIEKTLATHGYVGFCKDPEIGYLFSTGTMTDINHYGLMTKFKAYSPVYDREFTIDKDCVMIYNNIRKEPDIVTIKTYSMLLSEIKKTQEINLQTLKTPYILSYPKSLEMTIENIYNQISAGALKISTDSSIELDNFIKVFNLNIPILVNDLQEYYDKIYSECLTLLGVNNDGANKKDRVVVSEVESNNSQVYLNMKAKLRMREQAVEKINKLFNLNIKVKPIVDIYTDTAKNKELATDRDIEMEDD